MLKRTLFITLLISSSGSLASSDYPAVIKTQLGLSTDHPRMCRLCHTSDLGGSGTITQPFGKALQARGLASENAELLKTALAQLEADKVDSDGDGVTDIDELKALTDPNKVSTGGGEDEELPPLKFGCGAQSVVSLIPFAALFLFVRAPGRRRSRQ